MGRKRYSLTPKRRQSILKAQKISARKRRVRPKDTVGYWIAKGVRKGANKASLGVAGTLADLQEGYQAVKKRRRRGR